jgi:hypothetical protein
MRLVPKPMGFTYRMTYVPKGAQNPRPSLFRGADSAAVQHIDPDEARQAFRITWPEIDVWPLVNPRKPRTTTWQCIGAAQREERTGADRRATIQRTSHSGQGPRAVGRSEEISISQT